MVDLHPALRLIITSVVITSQPDFCTASASGCAPAARPLAARQTRHFHAQTTATHEAAPRSVDAAQMRVAVVHTENRETGLRQLPAAAAAAHTFAVLSCGPRLPRGCTQTQPVYWIRLWVMAVSVPETSTSAALPHWPNNRWRYRCERAETMSQAAAARHPARPAHSNPALSSGGFALLQRLLLFR